MSVTLIVEDGTGVVDANTYITVAEAKAYAENRGIDLGSDDVISANLVLAADFMETTGPYKGYVFSKTQGLEFPRKETLNEMYTDGVPSKVKKAQSQLLLDIKQSGALLTSSRQYALKRRKLEGLEQEYAVGSYAAYSPKAEHTIYDNLMREFKVGGGGSYLYR